MAGQNVLFIVISIVLQTCISVSWGQTCNWTSHEASRIQLKHETKMLDGWIDVANGFVHAAAPKDLTALDKIGQYRKGNGNLEFKDLFLDLLRMEVVFAACLFLGLIYFLTMGTGWSCFLCCRCCGNCGANKSQRQTKSISTRRCIYVVLTTVVLGFLVAAVTCAFLANEEIYQVITKGKGSIQEVIDTVEVYVNNTQNEIKTLDGCFEDTKKEIISSAEDEEIEQGLAKELKDEIQDQSAPILTSLKRLDDDFKKVKNLEEKVEFVKEKERNLEDLKNTIQDLQTNCTSVPPDNECIELNQLVLNEFNEETDSSFSKLPTKVDKVFELYFHKEFQDQINEIPKKIVQETVKSRNDIITEIKSFEQNKDLVNEIEKGVNDFHTGANDFEKELNENFSKYVTSQEVYWYWGVFGLIMLVALPSGLLFLGLCCGLLGSKSGRYPSERSGLSSCGGCTMMASVYLMFIMGSIAMLFTVAFFQVGGHVEAYGCRYLYEKDLKTVDRLLDIFLPNNDSKVMEDLKSLKIGEIANKCENDSAIYAAIPSLETMLNVQLTFDKEIDKIKFDGYEVDIIDMVKKALENLINDLDNYKKSIDIPALNELLARSTEKIMKADIAATAEVLKKLVNSPLDKRKQLSEKALKILQDLQEADIKRGEITTTLGSTGEEIDKYKTLVDNTMVGIEAEIRKMTPKILVSAQEMVKEFCQDILDKLKDFANEATETIKEKVGKCGTLYDAFSLGRHFVCRQVLGPLNALWFSLGACCFFFLFAIPFATKLSKHFYVMDEDEDYYIGMDSLHGQHINGYAEHQVPLHKGANNFSNGRPRPMHQHQNSAYEPDIEERWTRY